MNAPFGNISGKPFDATGRPNPAFMPSLEVPRLQCYLALVIVDVVAIVASYWLAGYLYLGWQKIEYVSLFAQLALPVFLTITLYNGAYSVFTLQQAGQGVIRVWVALGIATALVQFFAFYARANHAFSRVGVALGTIFAVLALALGRMAMRRFIRWRCGSEVVNQLLIEDDGARIATTGYHISANEFGLNPNLDDPYSLHLIGSVLRNADQVIIDCPRERRPAWATILKSANVTGYIVDENVNALGARSARIFGSLGVLEVSSGPLGIRARLAKRLFDLAASALLIALFAPIMAITALAIALEDGRPILFIQQRVGRGNRFISVLKFRSMRLRQADAHGSTSVVRGDQRITRIGRFIRGTSLDELPQLFNVLTGSMSMVGPRPHALQSQAGEKLFWEVDDRYWLRHALKPGITGLAQIRGWRGATDTENDLRGRLEADLEYLRGWTLWRDLRILFATFRVIVHDRAY